MSWRMVKVVRTFLVPDLGVPAESVDGLHPATSAANRVPTTP
jgi:hypothetical protein